MDTVDWLEAISYYFIFFKQHAFPEITSHFDTHFQLLSRQNNFKCNFPVIIAADIEYHQNYSAQPHTHDQKAFEQHFSEIKLRKITELKLHHSQLADYFHHVHSSPHSEPYPHNVPGSCSKSVSSFHSSPGDSSTTNHLYLILICTRPGRKFSSC
jgi:hypothetical protein